MCAILLFVRLVSRGVEMRFDWPIEGKRRLAKREPIQLNRRKDHTRTHRQMISNEVGHLASQFFFSFFFVRG